MDFAGTPYTSIRKRRAEATTTTAIKTDEHETEEKEKWAYYHCPELQNFSVLVQ
jgi:hypothetical protein